MILALLIIIPFLFGILAWVLGKRKFVLSRWVSLAALLLDAFLLVPLWTTAQTGPPQSRSEWISELNIAWIPGLGASVHLGVDGLSLVLVSLTVLLGVVSVLCSWHEVRDRIGFFHLNLLWTIAGILGVFLALDLLLFYSFWELMLVPMYFLISIWGHENRKYASYKFFLFTQVGGLLMLLSILALYLAHGKEAGSYTFDYTLLLKTALSPAAGVWIMLGFLAAFAVKLPVVPFHTWLPDAHTEAPTAGSVILAGLLLKTGAYGMLRFVLPLFPGASGAIAPVMMLLAVIGIVYGAVLAFGQTDLKRMIAYTSVSHMGFVLLGIFSGNLVSLSGAALQMLAHGVSTGALFLIAGLIQERIHTRDLDRMGGLWSSAPRLAAFGLAFALASLGLPGTGNFVAEFLVLLGSFRVNIWLTAAAASGLVLGAVYSLGIVQRAFHGAQQPGQAFRDLDRRETLVLAALLVAVLWLGLRPGTVTRITEPVLGAVQCCAPHTPVPEGRQAP